MPTFCAAGRLAILSLLTSALAGCSSEPDYAPKTQAELNQMEQEHRVYYEGWRHPQVSEHDRDFFYRTFNQP